MNIPYEFEPFYNKIVEPNIFIQDQWYMISGNRTERDFLEWYYKETMAIEFSGDRRHFRVVAYPVRSVVPDFLMDRRKPVIIPAEIENPKTKNSVSKIEARHEPVKIGRPLDSVELERQRIVEKIMAKWEDKQKSSTIEHEKRLEFLRRKKEFFGQIEN